jgi:ankyrin repeat protein
VDSLQAKRTKKKVQVALQALQKGGDPLHSAYDEALQRIDGQVADDASLAKQALSWITHAQRPLTVQELCHALAIEDGITELDASAIYEIEDVLSVCAGLVTVDKESNIVRLVHYTTQEYFDSEQVRLKWMPTAQRDIAAVCLTYLCMDAFVSGPCNSDKAFEERLRDHILLDYAACHWGTHTRPEEKAISDLALAFLSSSTLVLATTQVALQGRYKWSQDYSQRYPYFDNGLYLTSRYGLTYLTGALVEQPGYESKIDLKDTKYGQTPLSWAARYGHEAVVRLLLDTGKVDVDAKDTKYSRTPLSWAVLYGHEAMVRLLLNTGKVDIDAKDTSGRTPLSWAARYGHEAVVRLLLNTGKVDVDAKDTSGRTPLSWAVEKGHKAVVKLLQTKARPPPLN